MSQGIESKIVESAVEFRDASLKMSGFSDMLKEMQSKNFDLSSEEPSPELVAFLKKNEGALEAERTMVESTQKLFQLVDEYNAINGVVKDNR